MTESLKYYISIDGISDKSLKTRILRLVKSIMSSNFKLSDTVSADILICDNLDQINNYLPLYKYIIALGEFSSPSTYVFSINVDSHLKSNLDNALKFLRKQISTKSEEISQNAYLDSISDIVFSMNKEGIVTQLNKSFENVLDLKREDIVGKSFVNVIHPDDIELSLQKFQELITNKLPQNVDLRLKKGTNSSMALEIKSTPIVKNGEILIINGIARDITKRKNIEIAWKESKSKYEDLLNSIQDIVIVFDIHWKCVFANNICKDFLASAGNNEKTEGQTLFQIFPGILHTELYSILEKVMHSRSSDNIVINSQLFDGKNRWLNFGIYPASEGILCLIRDITGSKVIETALHENRENLRSTLMSMDDLVYVLDKNNIFVDIYTPNKANVYLPGPDDILGKSIDESMSQDMANSFKKYISAAKTQRQSHDFIFYIDKLGKRKWFSSRFTARRNTENSYLGTTIVVRDITENQNFRDKLIASENKFKTVVNHFVDGLILFDTNGTILDTNIFLGKILRTQNRVFLNNPIWKVLEIAGLTAVENKYDTERLKNLFYDFRAKSRSTKTLSKYSIQLIDDRRRDLYLQIFLFPFETSTDFLFAAIIRDVSDQVRVEKEIKALNNDLELRVRERTAQLEDAFQDLSLEIHRREKIENDLMATKEDLAKALSTERDLNELKNKFITMISHQYRTPITVIRSSLDLMETYFKQGNVEKYNKHTSKIKKAISTLIQLLENVTAFQSSNDGKLTAKFESIDLERNLSRIVDEISIYDNSSHKLIFSYKTDEKIIKSDSKLLFMVVNNLIINSIKYSPSKSKIKISVESDEKFFYITIEDEGIGITKEELKVIFDPFIRSDKVSPTMGSGLGLTIVQRCLELLGGIIKIESEPNKYTVVRIRLSK